MSDSDGDGDQERTTQRGYLGGPLDPAPLTEDRTAVTLPPFVEVELVYERGRVDTDTRQWRFLEVWTRNRIYVVDTSMTCVEVSDRVTGVPDPDHALIGAHLAGGQRKTADAMEMTHPLPRPDTEAVFERATPRDGYVSTSTVTRVVLRLRVLTVPHEHVRPAWDELSGVSRLPGRR